MRQRILELGAKHGAKNIRVFGSIAKGLANPKSDLDLIVDRDSNCSAFFPGGLVADLEDLLGRPVDIVVEGSGLHWYIRDKILQEAIPL